MSEELKWHTGRPDGFVIAAIEWYDGLETVTACWIYDPQNKEWTDGNHGIMVTPDRWVDINTYIEITKAQLAAAKEAERTLEYIGYQYKTERDAARSENERLRAQIATHIEYDPASRDTENDLHMVCVQAVGEMMKAGITRHISYVDSGDLTAFGYPGWPGESNSIPKVTIEWVDIAETIDDGD